MFLEIALIAVVVGLIRGGTLANIKELEFKLVSFIFSSYLIQFCIDFWGAMEPWWGYPYLHLLSYLLLFAALYSNRIIPGIKFIFAGTFLNFAAIVLNGGVMPVAKSFLSEKAVAAFAAGLGGTHGLMTDSTRLRFLADILYIPVPYDPQVLSVGDIVIDVGIFAIIISAMGRRPEA